VADAGASWPTLFAGWRRSAIYRRGIELRLECGCQVVWITTGDLFDRRFCPTHYQERQAEARERIQELARERQPITTEEAREWLREMAEASANMLEAEVAMDREHRRDRG